MIDAHAHLHPRFRLEAFLGGAAAHFRRAARARNLPADAPGCLLLADGEELDSFPRWGEGGIDRACREWTAEPAGEPGAVLARRKDGARILLVPGRQVKTAGRLEILLLGFRGDAPDGADAEDTVRRGLDVGALVVVPWGLGKWWGARGKALRRLLDRGDPDRLFLGDTANRPARGGEPALFRDARRRGYRILPGSDPFPFRGDESRAGSYGFHLEGAPDPDGPVRSIRERLAGAVAEPVPFGRRERIVPFLFRQAAMQIRKVKR